MPRNIKHMRVHDSNKPFRMWSIMCVSEKRSFRTRGENRPQYANKPAQRQTSSILWEHTASEGNRERGETERERTVKVTERRMSWNSHEDTKTERKEKRWTVNLGQIWTLCMRGSRGPAWLVTVQNLHSGIVTVYYARLRIIPNTIKTMQSTSQSALSVTHALWRELLAPCCESQMFRSILVTANESLPTDPNATECAKSQIHHHRTHTHTGMPVVSSQEQGAGVYKYFR